MRKRIERLARARHSHLSSIIREALAAGLPILEREIADRVLNTEEVAV
jgi:hypothetical protein